MGRVPEILPEGKGFGKSHCDGERVDFGWLDVGQDRTNTQRKKKLKTDVHTKYYLGLQYLLTVRTVVTISL